MEAHFKVFTNVERVSDLLESLSDSLVPVALSEIELADAIFGTSDLRSQALVLGTPFVLVEEDLSLESVLESRYQHKDFSALETKMEVVEFSEVVEETLRLLKKKWHEQLLRSNWIKENENLQEQLLLASKKVEKFEASRIQRAQALRKTSLLLRKRIFFLKSLNKAMELSEVVSMIQDEVRKTKGLGGAILAVKKNKECSVLYSSGRLVVERKIDTWPSSSTVEWRQSLANVLKRPIGPLLQFEGGKSKLHLFVEHQVPKAGLKDFISEWKLRMVGLQLVVDRFQLEKELSEAALFWEKTFDGLEEPIGIFDRNFNVIRANQLFTSDLMAQLNENTVRRGGQVFHVESYKIGKMSDLVEGAKVIHLSDQSSAYQLKQHMIQTEKIAALGQLAGHIAHELNNPLTGIRSLCQVLGSDSQLSEQVRLDVAEVEFAAHRCQKTIKNLLDYSKPHTEDHRTPTNVNDVVLNTLPLLKSLMGRFKNEVCLSPTPLVALIDAHMLQQVIFNLVTNACHAMGDGTKGTIFVETRAMGKKLLIRVQDEGPGVPEELRVQIFEPFFTTKGENEGTGLGLSLSLNVIRRFGGELSIDENYTKGAAFEIQLPLMEDRR